MAITKAKIFQMVHSRIESTGMSSLVVNIDDELRDTLYELSNDMELLFSATTVVTVADTATVTAPTGMNRILAAAVDGENTLEFGSFEDYEKSIEGDDTVITGAPSQIHQAEDTLYLFDPVPDAVYTIRLYGILEEDDVDDIDFDDRCREAVLSGTLLRLTVGKLLPDPTKAYFDRKMKLLDEMKMDYAALYGRARKSLMRSQHREPVQIKYRDF